MQGTSCWTLTRIAEHFGEARTRVEYVVKSRRIAPITKAGCARLFGHDAVQRVGEELRRIDEQRDAARAGGVA